MDTIIQFWDEDQNKYVEVSADNPLPVSLAAGEIDTAEIEDGAVTTAKLADGAVTPAKLQNPFAGQIVFADPNNRSKLILSKYPDGTGHNNAPTTFDVNAIYLHLGGTEYNTNSYRLIGVGYRHFRDTSHAAAVMGYQETVNSGNDTGRLLFATRNVTTDTAPTVRMTIEPDGQLLAGTGYAPSSDLSLATKKYVDDNLTTGLATKLTATQAAAQADSTATDVAGLVADFNALLAKLRTAGIIAT